MVEQFGFQEDLTVGDRDHVGWNKRGNVTTLGFDHWQRGQGTCAEVFVQLRGTLKQTGVKIENVTRICFAAWWAAQQQGHLTISNRLFGQVIIDDQSVFAVVTEVFRHRCRRVRCEELHRCRVRCGCRNDDRVFNRAGLFQLLHQLRNGRALLANRNIDAEQFLAVVVARCVVVGFLVQDGVQSNRGFTGLTVTNDKFPLATADWDHRVNGL